MHPSTAVVGAADLYHHKTTTVVAVSSWSMVEVEIAICDVAVVEAVAQVSQVLTHIIR